MTVTDPNGKPVDLVGSPFHILGSPLPDPVFPPALGAHTDSLLRELAGLDSSRIAELRVKGVIG